MALLGGDSRRDLGIRSYPLLVYILTPLVALMLQAWLPRLLAAEAIFLLFFTQWYLSRYLRLWRKLPFWQMVVMIIVLSALVFGGSWLWDRRKVSRQ